ncbi:hypothetical protein M9H77_01223 [Catharanthus roseus]|uniref:Uncharacterized protein n=1 Tax=Catharanthus roseus TaxID=4058 RepID=A0ACC0C4Y9_CATRO|nr:hypothetical protein M9H77_01223 [Catharanthus roseus]
MLKIYPNLILYDIGGAFGTRVAAPLAFSSKCNRDMALTAMKSMVPFPSHMVSFISNRFLCHTATTSMKRWPPPTLTSEEHDLFGQRVKKTKRDGMVTSESVENTPLDENEQVDEQPPYQGKVGLVSFSKRRTIMTTIPPWTSTPTKTRMRKETDWAQKDMVEDNSGDRSKWRPNLHPSMEDVSSTMVWIRLPELPIESFNEELLLRIGNHIETVIQVDQTKTAPWIILDHYLSVSKWRPNLHPSMEDVSSTMVWILLPELPIESFNEELLLRIGNHIETGYANPTLDETHPNPEQRQDARGTEGDWSTVSPAGCWSHLVNPRKWPPETESLERSMRSRHMGPSK